MVAAEVVTEESEGAMDAEVVREESDNEAELADPLVEVEETDETATTGQLSSEELRGIKISYLLDALSKASQ